MRGIPSSLTFFITGLTREAVGEAPWKCPTRFGPKQTRLCTGICRASALCPPPWRSYRHRVLQPCPAGRDESRFPAEVWIRQRSCGKRYNNGAEVCIIMYSEQAGGTKKKKKKKRRLDLGFLPGAKSVFWWNGIGGKASCLPNANISWSCKMCRVQPTCLEIRLWQAPQWKDKMIFFRELQLLEVSGHEHSKQHLLTLALHVT